MANTRPTWDDYKALLEDVIQEIVDAQDELADVQARLARAQTRLRDLIDNPPGNVPDVGGG